MSDEPQGINIVKFPLSIKFIVLVYTVELTLGVMAVVWLLSRGAL